MVDEQIDDVQLVIDDSVEPLLGKNPVVLLGPNGAGKSRLVCSPHPKPPSKSD